MKTKNFLIYAMLFAPIVAHATNPVGPSAVGQGETPVVATANAPYATAGAETGDTTNVVTASYVKGAYNDAIAAVNKVNASKQTKLISEGTGSEILSGVLSGDMFVDNVQEVLFEGDVSEAWEDHLVSVRGTALGIVYALDQKRVNAVTTWGNDNATQLGLSNAQ